MPDPLPSSGTISISEIATFYEGGSENLSLDELAGAIDTGPPNIAMSLFYAVCTSFAGSEQSKEPCELDPEITYYHNGSGTYPVAGDNVFTDSGCSEVLSEGSYKMASGNIMVIEGESGLVTTTFSC
jgi:hypothetical protein